MRLLEQKQKRLRAKLNEAKLNEDLSRRDIGIAKTIANLAARLGKEFRSAPENQKQGLIAALLLLNQAQSLVEKDSSVSRKLLTTARSVANVKEDA